MFSRCPCGSKKSYASCCEPLIKGARKAETAEELLRSRYTAHVKAEVDYIVNTVHPSKRKGLNKAEIREWAENTRWKGLQIMSTDGGGAGDNEGKIEFTAHFTDNGENKEHHELSHFKKKNDEWYFVDGKAVSAPTVTRSSLKVGRNDPCPCGSGRKYKKCCGA